MSAKVVTMLHVPDVRATADWYASISFTIVRSNEEDGEMNWALLSFGASEVMLNSGGARSSAWRREVDLYVHTDDVEAFYRRIKDRPENDQVDVVEGLHDTFYGLREFIIRDINRFWITFGQPMRT